MDQVSTTLREVFGFTGFRTGQEEVISHILAGRSAAAVFPTGSGKSLCYQLPALLLDGVTVVVSPLIALMKEQTERLKARGVAAASLDSTLSGEESRAVMSDLRNGRLKLLYLSPERFNNERTRQALMAAKIALFAVDEAHCISEWGHNFRPDYLKLAGFARACRAERILALTATATPAVLADICRGFAIDPACAVRTGFHRPNLSLDVLPAPSGRDALLEARIRAQPPGAAIVYVTTQKAAEMIAARLATAGMPARAYHAGMPAEERAAVQDWFQDAAHAVVVATIAFGMGVDKPDIRAVYHYNLPKSLENYSQEIGRAGRDGEPAVCEMLVAADDLSNLENFVYGDTPDRAAVVGLLADIFAGDKELLLNQYALSAAHDLRASVLSTLLTYLELDGFLEAGTPVYSTYRFQPQMNSKEILARYEGEERSFLTSVFRQSVKAKTWFDIDLAKTSVATGASRERIVGALDQLAADGLLILKVEGLRHRYRVLVVPPSLDDLATRLHDKLLAREERELARLDQVMELVRLDGCQTSYLGEHFGETLAEPCGRCRWCRTHTPVNVPERSEAPIDAATWDRAEALRSTHSDPLAAPRAFARFLCGLTSPRLTVKKLSSHPLFGVFADVPFRDLHARARGAMLV